MVSGGNDILYQQAKDLIGEGKHREARKLLLSIKEDKARKWISQIDAKFPPKKSMATWKILAVIFTPILIVIGSLIFWQVQQNNAYDAERERLVEINVSVLCSLTGVSEFECTQFYDSLTAEQVSDLRGCLLLNEDDFTAWRECGQRRGALP